MTKKKHRGWIRGKKVNGRPYYYYCSVGPGEDFPIVEEYLGSAEYIRDLVKKDKEKGSNKLP